ncbi:MAG: histidine kinase dimerization/phospho-acceptor domain-containing protein [Burkholderiaceae bacterium]|nr:histidine kinase dimerization/phospho-acceptor domain-containing protein [Burkholderiaceae bacterium]
MRFKPSLLRHLLAWELGAFLIVWASFVAFGYQTGTREADELTDGHLASVASLLLPMSSENFVQRADSTPLAPPNHLKAHDYQQSLSIVVWDGAGRVLAHTGDAPMPAFSLDEGFETLTLGTPAKDWRSFSRWDGPQHQRKISVLLNLGERDDLADDIAEQVAQPGLWLLPVITLALALALRRGLRPLQALSRQVHELEVHPGALLQEPSHEEFKTVVHSINHLIERYNAALERERALASEVAHELRTPLASISLHAASLQRALPPEERQQALRHIERDAVRAGHVLADLLTLARASRAELAEVMQPVDLGELARQVTAQYAQAALHSGHDLSLSAPAACMAQAHPVLLELALRNLIDNALSHTPRGTAVEVRVINEPLALEVWDNGAAVTRVEGHDADPSHATATGPPSGEEAEGFLRRPGLGLGLGHQVVGRVAAVHAGRLETEEDTAAGLRCYRIALPHCRLTS